MTRNWELNVQFKVHGKAKELFGDGLVLWYVKDRMVQGPVFGSKDYFSGLAIILDTYSNHNGPHNVTEIEQPFQAVYIFISTSSYLAPASVYQCDGKQRLPDIRS